MAANMARETPEIAAIRQNVGTLNDTFSDNLQWFADRLVEKAFITQPQAHNILGIHGIGPADKAGRLLDGVFTMLRNTDRKKHWFDEFIAILSLEPAYAELVDNLKRSHASWNNESQTAPVDERVLGIEHLRDLIRVLNPAAHKWQAIGTLILEKHHMTTIGSDITIVIRGVSGCFCEMLSIWLKQAPPRHPYPTVGTLAEALRDCDEHDLAKHLEEMNFK